MILNDDLLTRESFDDSIISNINSNTTLIIKKEGDDYTNIKNTIDNRTSNNILFTSGEYIINKQLDFPSDVNIQFEQGVVLKYNGNSEKALTFSSNTIVDGLNLLSLNNKTANTYGVFCKNSNNISFKECTITDFGYSNVGLNNCDNIKFNNCILKNCGLKNDAKQTNVDLKWYGQGIYANMCKNLNITNSTIVDNGMHGIKLDKTSSIRITNNKISNNGDCGVSLLTCEVATISNNDCCNNGYNGGNYGGQGIQVVGSKTGGVSKYITINNNTTNGNQENGIECTIHVEHSVISNNITENNVWSGIAINPTCYYITVSNNISLKNGTNGISCLTSDNCIFNGNTTNDNNQHGMNITRSNNINISSFISNNNGKLVSNRCGIFVDSKCNGVYIRNGITDDNQSTHTQAYGVRINSCNGGECSGLSANGNLISPITISASYSSNIALNNPSINNSAYGGIKYVTNARLVSGKGNPDFNVTAPVGSVFMRTDGTSGETFYVKERGDGNSGWVAK